MHAAELDDLASFQRLTETKDGVGGADESWAEYAEEWVNVRAMTGRERENAMRTEARADYIVTIRYRDDVRPGDRIEWRERFLNVRFVKDSGPRETFLQIEAEMGAAS